MFVAIRSIVLKRDNNRKDADLDELDLNVVRYRPVALETLSKCTQFSKKELQIMYRGFKQECPTGIVSEETFKDIYCQFFPQGEASSYAHHVFRTFDKDNTGQLTFEQFVQNLSTLSRGSPREKLRWAFRLYDLNGDGHISKSEMIEVVNAIYEMLGKYTDPPITDQSTKDHVDRTFQRLDLNKDGLISEDEFIQVCENEQIVLEGMENLNTLL